MTLALVLSFRETYSEGHLKVIRGQFLKPPPSIQMCLLKFAVLSWVTSSTYWISDPIHTSQRSFEVNVRKSQ